MTTSSLPLEGDCTIGRMRELRMLVGEALARPGPLVLDVAAVTRADIAFVQLVASASKTLGPRGGSVTLVGSSEDLRATFGRAGLDVDRGTGRVSLPEA